MKKFLALSLTDVVHVFIMLINVKMPTIVGILTFMSRMQDKFQAQLSWAWKKFYNLRPWPYKTFFVLNSTQQETSNSL